VSWWGVVPLRDADASYALYQGCKHWHPYGGNREDYDIHGSAHLLGSTSSRRIVSLSPMAER